MTCVRDPKTGKFVKVVEPYSNLNLNQEFRGGAVPYPMWISPIDAMLYRLGASSLVDSAPYDPVTRDHRDGIARLKQPILTMMSSFVGQSAKRTFSAVLLSYDEVIRQIQTRPVYEPEDVVRHTLELSVIQGKMPKLRQFDGATTIRNRRMSFAKAHVCQHRALFIRDLDLILAVRDPQYARYPTAEDFRTCPGLRTVLANPDTQYQDLKAMRNGHVVLSSVTLQETLGWDVHVLGNIESGKQNSRLSIAARLDMVEWADAPPSTYTSQMELHLLTQEDAERRFGADLMPALLLGHIPVTAGLAKRLKIYTRTRRTMGMQDGDKLRGLVVPFKGTVHILREKVGIPKGFRGTLGDLAQVHTNRRKEMGLRLYLIEGGALKMKLNGQSRVITVTRSELLGDRPPFAVETPSLERLMRSPRFSQHPLQAMIGQIRALDPEIAAQLVPRIDERVIRLASGQGAPLEYVSLCLFPTEGTLDRATAMGYCEQILNGTLVAPIVRGRIVVPGSTPDSPAFSFGVNAAGRWLLHGVKPTVWKVWEILKPLIRKEILKQLHTRVEGVGGVAQADSAIPIGQARVSLKVWAQMKGKTEACALYWPSKYPLFIHRIDIKLDPTLTGAVVRVNPRVLDALGGDCDGDNFFLITDDRIMPHVFKATDAVVLTDRLTKTETVYPNLVEAVLAGRTIASEKITATRTFLESIAIPEPDPHLRAAQVNRTISIIGRGFIARDVLLDHLGFDDLMSTVLLGELCHENLAGLKLSSPVNVGAWYVGDPMHLAEYLGVPRHMIPYVEPTESHDQFGRPTRPGPIWQIPGHYRDCYRSFAGREDLDIMVRTAKNADPTAASLFEWMLARTGIADVLPAKIIRADDLMQFAQKVRTDQKVRPRQERDAKFLVTRTALEPIALTNADGHPVGTIRAQDARHLRARKLYQLQVPKSALEVVVCEHAAETGNVDVLGVLSAYRQVVAG